MIQVVNRAFDILEYVSKDYTRPKQLGHIARDLDLNAATCANIVKTLVDRGYLRKSDTQKGYLLGKQLYAVANNTSDYKTLIEVADDEMKLLTKKINENTLLAVLNGSQRKVIHKRNANQLVNANTPEEKHAYDSSTGRILLASMSDAEIEKFIKKFGLPSASIWPNITTKKQLLDQIELIRSNGYALIEDSVQVVGVAVAIYKKGQVEASLSIYLPAFRFTNVLKQEMLQLILESAKRISRKLA